MWRTTTPSRSRRSRNGHAAERCAAVGANARRRHAVMLWVLWLHAVALVTLGFRIGLGPAYALAAGAVPGGMALIASWPQRGRRFRATAASLGLVATSGVIVQMSGGNIEMHF